VDFEPTPEQRAIVEAVGALCARHAGAARAAELAAKGEMDAALEQALDDAGFFDVALADGGGPLEAALVVEAVARGAGLAAAGAGALVAPFVAGRSVARPVALARAGDRHPVRYAAHARTLLRLDADGASLVALGPGDAAPVRSRYGFPLGRLGADALARRGEPLGPGAGGRLVAAWRVALCAELVGTMDGALARTTAYLRERRQFGRPIAAFQAVQHRLAECAIAIDGARWLAREAAWRGAPVEASATAAAFAADAAARVFAECHQLSGAVGYTLEHGLHVFTMRLVALRLELGGAAAHRRAAAHARWPALRARRP
jgi:alkylation response protein AidB-like acyl-CoA dehydrogenase